MYMDDVSLARSAGRKATLGRPAKRGKPVMRRSRMEWLHRGMSYCREATARSEDGRKDGRGVFSKTTICLWNPSLWGILQASPPGSLERIPPRPTGRTEARASCWPPRRAPGEKPGATGLCSFPTKPEAEDESGEDYDCEGHWDGAPLLMTRTYSVRSTQSTRKLPDSTINRCESRSRSDRAGVHEPCQCWKEAASGAQVVRSDVVRCTPSISPTGAIPSFASQRAPLHGLLQPSPTDSDSA